MAYIWSMNSSLPPKLSVFLADDDADDRLLFEEALMEVSNHVKLITAKNGEQLLEVLDKESSPVPHLIFLDLNMPIINGFQCLEQIKNDEKYTGIPVVIFSTSCQKEAIDEVYSKGADFYICKPDSFQKLKVLLNRVFAMNREPMLSRPSREDFLIMA